MALWFFQGVLKLLVGFYCFSLTCAASLEKTLPHFERLNKADFQHRVYRRSLGESSSSTAHDRDITFFSHGQMFVMKLTQSKDIFDSSFTVVSVDRDGKESPVDINIDYFYKGYVEGYPSSYVNAHLDDDGLMTATVSMGNETYVVEPMWRHVDGDPSHDVIVYKASDVKSNATMENDQKGGQQHVSMCGNIDDVMDDNVEENKDSGKSRYRRSTCTKRVTTGRNDTCKLHLVADYSFCKNVGRKDSKTTAYYMLQVVIVVNQMFRETSWDCVGKGYGVEVKKVSVHCDGFSTNPSYNAQLNWGVDSLLTEFSRHDWSAVCLAHLFTYQDFDNGVIGLAYVGNPKSQYGGICSKKTRDNRSIRKHNCGFTSYINWGRRLTSLEANIVTAHEIGHNFGSRHDSPSKKQCSPGGSSGNFIMYASSVSGEQQNNNKFSSCSKEQVGKVISVRQNLPGCLSVAGGSRCGNGIVESGEQCDEGSQRKCCTENCKFDKGAVCSDSNSLCCHKCQIATKGLKKICRESYTYGCQDETKCDGTSKDCPMKSPILTSGECITIINDMNRKGECNERGVCESVCKLTKTCTCTGVDACKVCCMTGGKCTPHDPVIKEVDGVHCNATNGNPGYCSEKTGKCEEIQRDVKETFANLFEDFTLDKAVKWMENNIVITIIVFSLFIWVPAGVIVTIIDRHEDSKYEELKEAEEKDHFTRERVSFKKKKGERRGGGNI